jgi:hypothetical protein
VADPVEEFPVVFAVDEDPDIVFELLGEPLDEAPGICVAYEVICQLWIFTPTTIFKNVQGKKEVGKTDNLHTIGASNDAA